MKVPALFRVAWLALHVQRRCPMRMRKLPPCFDFQDEVALDGKDVDFSRNTKGKCLLVVNTASHCGATPQYEQLQSSV